MENSENWLLVPQLSPIFTVLDLIPKYQNARKRFIFESPPNKKMYTEHPGAPFQARRSHRGHHLLKTPVSTAVQPAVLPQYSGDRYLNDPFEPGVFCRAPLHPPEALGLPWHIWELNLARLKNSVIEKFRSFVAGVCLSTGISSLLHMCRWNPWDLLEKTSRLCIPASASLQCMSASGWKPNISLAQSSCRLQLRKKTTHLG